MKIRDFLKYTAIFLFAIILFIACEEDKNFVDDNYAIIEVKAEGFPTEKLIITVNDDNLSLTADDIKINAGFSVIKRELNKTGAKTYELQIIPGGTNEIKVGLNPYRGFTGWNAKNVKVYADWYFSGTSELITITGRKQTNEPLVISPQIYGITVAEIGNYAFYNEEWTGVDIKNGVKRIGDGAFEYNQLKSIDIPVSVKTIGSVSFAFNQLSTVTFNELALADPDPNTIITIGSGAFAYNQLSGISIPEKITEIKSSTFAYNELAETIDIPENVTSIGDDAFAYNKISNVKFHEDINITRIGNGAFGNNKLTIITIPNTVTFLSGFNNNELESITICDNVTAIGSGAFAYNKLTNIVIPDSVTTIGSNAFAHNEIAAVSLSQNIITIGYRTFANNNISEVTIPSKVIYIDVHAFLDNPLTKITIGENVTLGSSAFGNGFENAYYKNGRTAGTYTFADGEWTP